MSHKQQDRQNFYRFLSLVFEKEVTADFLNKLRSISFPAAPGSEEVARGYAGLKNFFATPLANPEEELAVDYAKVFLGAGGADSKAAFPYESVYTSPEGIVMQNSWTEVCALYAAKGLKLSAKTADLKEDHIAVELLYMAELTTEEKDEQIAFLQDHLLNWVEDFAERVKKYSTQQFYPAMVDLLVGFLKMDLADLTAEGDTDAKAQTSSVSLTRAQADEVLAELKKTYRVFAPKRVGTRSGANVRFQEINTISEIVLDKQSDYSAKELYYPVMQTMIYFSETEATESKLPEDKDMLILGHPCDINAIRRLDQIFLRNGGEADSYYKRLRDRVKMVMLECTESYENCFCVSMGSNIATDYEAAVKIDGDAVLVQIASEELTPLFEKYTAATYTPAFITENKKKVTIPEINSREELKRASELPFWNQFDEKCIGCGGCNTVCPTCACFDTRDILYDEQSLDGERRRVWSSCMLDTFTQTAGGGRARATAGANMRFKTLHKVYDYKKRFDLQEHMCVGCGRCVNRCPKDISFIDTVNGFTKALNEA